MIYDEKEIRKTISVLKPDNQLFEIRILGGGKKVRSGYFTDVEKMLDELSLVNDDGDNVYISLQSVRPECYSRQQRDNIIGNPKNTTSDTDIAGFEWLFIDLDPIRPAGVSSTEDQVKKAKELGNKIYKFMAELGFEKPVRAFSGNGVHLLYKIRLRNDSDNTRLIEKSLKTLNMLFQNEYVDVDMKTFNPSRVAKLYGTLSQKGSNTEDAPHRMSYIIGDYAEVKTTDKKYLEELCKLYPEELDKPRKYNNYNPVEFDLEEWMGKYGLRYRKSTFKDGDKYILDCCPFDSNHKNKDACIFRSRNGAIGFKCLHNSCSDRHWQDVRMLFEPDAYEKKQQHQEKKMYQSFNRDRKIEPKHIVEERDNPVFYSAIDILNKPKMDETFIRTGTEEIDKYMRGLKKGYVSLVSGLRGASKSTWLSGVILSAVDSGNNTACYSGELSEKNFMRWLNLQAAGKSRVEHSQYPGYYNVPKKYQEQIAEWLGDHFWLYNNDYGNSFTAMLEQFEKAIVEKKLDLLVLDNLMALDISDLSQTKYEAQTQFIWKIHRLAESYNVHIIIVCHPRKALGFLRLDDVSGTADLTNAVQNAFIIHRNNNDFQRLSKTMFGWYDDNPCYLGTNVIEIAKDRDGGIQDKFIPLYYEQETKRLKNNPTEHVIYGWDKDENGFSQVNDEEIVFD